MFRWPTAEQPQQITSVRHLSTYFAYAKSAFVMCQIQFLNDSATFFCLCSWRCIIKTALNQAWPIWIQSLSLIWGADFDPEKSWAGLRKRDWICWRENNFSPIFWTLTIWLQEHFMKSVKWKLHFQGQQSLKELSSYYCYIFYWFPFLQCCKWAIYFPNEAPLEALYLR